MDRQRDPVQARDDGSLDLYDIADWEPRGALDRFAVALHAGLLVAFRALLIGLAVSILLAQVVLGGLGALADPVIGGLAVSSALPALALAAYIWYVDVTTREPLSLVVGTFLLGVLTAGFAGVLNVEFGTVFDTLGLGLVPFYFLVVGPVEEGVKLLAVRLHAYRSDRFDAVVDGAVYGAVAGLGFATIENAYYIVSNIGQVPGGAITSVRALAGPGHVIYSAFAGYYLGLAKFNPDRAGPIVVKGLLIAAFIHATYNTLVGPVPGVAAAVTGSSQLLMFFTFVILYDGLFGYILYRKLKRYRKTYRDVGAGEERTEADITPERTEFERSGFD